MVSFFYEHEDANVLFQKTYYSARNLEPQNSFTIDVFQQDFSDDDTFTSDMLKKIDRTGTNSISKDDIFAVIRDLRQARQANGRLGQANKLLQRTVMASALFFVLLLSAMVSLSFAVDALSAKLDVDSSTGVMTTPDGMHAVSTDSVAYKVVATIDDATGTNCLDYDDVGEMLQRVVSGNGVLLETLSPGVLGTQTAIQKLSGSMHAEEGEICFLGSNGKEVCAKPSSARECAVITVGQPLTGTDYVSKCLAAHATFSSMPTVFGYLVSAASRCITENCTSDVYSISPAIYGGSACVCECARKSNVEFVFSVVSQ